mmetsp:Transcript_77193/g.200886  ORF Transcript_77193/g.200886 Transcript_77193/m.200886 type:complete len:431 (-) Transcript_77193:285-1577(-)
MGVQPVPLDDLLGFSLSYSKLQDLLKQLITNANEQDAAIQSLRDDATKSGQDLEQRLANQDASIAQLKTQVSDATSTIDQALSEAASQAQQGAQLEERLASRLQPLEKELQRLGPLEQRLHVVESKSEDVEKSIGDVEKSIEATRAAQVTLVDAAKAMAEETHSLGARAEHTEKALDALTSQFQRQASATAQLAEMQAKLSVVDKLQQTAESLTANVDGMSKALVSAEQRLGSQEERLDGVAQELCFDELRALCNEARAESGRIGELCGDLDKKVAGCCDDLTKQQAEYSKDLQRLDEGIRAAKADSGSRALIESLSKKINTDLSSVKGKLDGVSGQLDEFMTKGSAAVARCLCCYTKTSAKQPQFLVGTDGKSYMRGVTGEKIDFGRLNTNLPANLLVPAKGAGRRVLSPVKSGRARPMTASASAGALQ